MPNVQVTVDDAAPQIEYRGAGWSQNHTDDASLPSYFKGTFMSTNVLGDTATFNFKGASIAIYGAKRTNHGTYTVNLDSDPPISSSGTGDQLFQQQLFSKNGLDSSSSHQVVITNTQAGAYFDLDFIVYEATIGASADLLNTTIIDDAAGKFTFTPPIDWSLDPAGVTNWQTQSFVNALDFNTTFTATSIAGCSVTVPLVGSSIQVFGGLNTNHGNYSVTLDSQASEILSGNANAAAGYLPRQQIYGVSGLTEGAHQLVFTNLEDGLFWDIDYIVFNSSSSTASSTISSASSTPSSSSPVVKASSGISSGAIAGIVVGVVALLAGIGAALYFCLDRRRRSQAEDKGNGVGSMDGRESFDASNRNGPDVVEVAPTPFYFGLPSSPNPNGSFQSLSNTPSSDLALGAATQGTREHDASSTNTPSNRPQSSGYDASSLPRTSELPADPGSRNSVGPNSRGSVDASGQAVPTPLATGGRRTKSGEIVLAPPTSIGGERMRVLGREQDAGPLILKPLEEDEDVLASLPPDYVQATQSFEPTETSSTPPIVRPLPPQPNAS